jgi:hypothetical protein
MLSLRFIALAGALAFTLAACAQTPTGSGKRDHAAHHPPAAGAASASGTVNHADHMAKMDAHMQSMREMHEKMSRAQTPQQRDALMAEHMKLMQDGMTVMGGTGPGSMAGGMSMGGMHGMRPIGAASAPMDMSSRHQMMEKRMEMMQSMMQMMMDRMGAPAAKP